MCEEVNTESQDYCLLCLPRVEYRLRLYLAGTVSTDLNDICFNKEPSSVFLVTQFLIIQMSDTEESHLGERKR